MNKQKGLAPIIVVILMAALAVGGYLIYSQQSKPAPVQQATQPTPIPDETANWKTYKSEKLGFEFKYPPQYTIKVYEELNRMSVLIDPQYRWGFSVLTDKNSHLVSYDSLQTCDKVFEQINRDDQTARVNCLDNGKKFGQEQDVSDVILGGISAKSFYVTSTGQGGTTRVIQTVNNPRIQIYLMTYQRKDFDKIIDQILSTFKFTP